MGSQGQSGRSLLHLAAERLDHRLRILDVVVRQPQHLPPQVRKHLRHAEAPSQRQRLIGGNYRVICRDVKQLSKAGDRLSVRGLLGLGNFGSNCAGGSRAYRIGAKADRTVQL